MKIITNKDFKSLESGMSKLEKRMDDMDKSLRQVSERIESKKSVFDDLDRIAQILEVFWDSLKKGNSSLESIRNEMDSLKEQIDNNLNKTVKQSQLIYRVFEYLGEETRDLKSIKKTKK